MRIVVHGQQAFGKAVLEALLKRGENVVAVYVAPEKPGQKADPLKEAALAAKLPVYQPASYRKPEVWEEFKALTPDLQVARRMALMWGAHSVKTDEIHSYEEMVKMAEATVRAEDFAQLGDLVVVVAGIPFGQSGSTNNLRIIRIGG